jgi:hypothetical protein
VTPAPQLLRRYLLAASSWTLTSSMVEVTLPLVAVVALGQGSTQVGLLTGAVLATALLVQVPAGVWSDRRRRHSPHLAALRLTDAALVLLTAVTLWLGVLTFPLLLVATVLHVVLATVAGSLGYHLVNLFTDSSTRGRAIGHLQAAREATSVAGQSLGPALLAAWGAPAALASAAAGALASALVGLGLVRPESALLPVEEPRVGGDRGVQLRAGLGSAARRSATPLLLAVGVSVATSLTVPVHLLFLLRDLAVPVRWTGAVVAVGSSGAVVAGLVLDRVRRAAGTTRTCQAAAVVAAAGPAVLLLARPGALAAPAVGVSEFLSAFGGALLVGALMSDLQQSVDARSLSTVLSAVQVALQGGGLVGIAVATGLATALTRRHVVEVSLGLLVTVVAAGLLTAARSRPPR